MPESGDIFVLWIWPIIQAWAAGTSLGGSIISNPRHSSSQTFSGSLDSLASPDNFVVDTLDPSSQSFVLRIGRIERFHLPRLIPACAGNGLRRKSKTKANLQYWPSLYWQKLSKTHVQDMVFQRKHATET